MSLQTIKSLDGKEEYVLVPVAVYRALKDDIENKVAKLKKQSVKDGDYVPFVLEDYVDNPVSVARIKAGWSQAELAERMGVTQAYISKVEAQDKVSAKLMQRVTETLKR
ncbi:MAG: helix-turn-helix transcriptional regulator [Thiobacillaceae bacterium]